MQNDKRRVMRDCSRGSLEGTMPFPEVVARLTEIGCERYQVDFRRQEKAYFMPDGETYVERLPVGGDIANEFLADKIVAALRAIQRGEIDYRKFLGRIMVAGCVGYFVYIKGRRAIYLGRDGDFYVEPFPPIAETASARSSVVSPAAPAPASR